MTAEIVPVPFGGGYLHSVLVDGEPHVVLRPTLEGIGLDYSAQLKKLRTRSWATVAETATVAIDGKARDMASVDLDTWAMLLANIDENRVSAAAKPLVIEYQKGSARALREFWTKGYSVHPEATEEQLREAADEIAHRRRLRQVELAAAEAELVKSLDGYVDPVWLNGELRAVVDAGRGIVRQVEAADRTLMVESFLAEKGMPKREIDRKRGTFGKRLKAAYIDAHGEEPGGDVRRINGRDIPTFVYYERDRSLFEQVWEQHYAPRDGAA